eukprot:gene23427-24872_t
MEPKPDPENDCKGITQNDCKGDGFIQGTCPTTCGMCYSTTTVTTTTTTRACNGKGDPPECGSSILESSCKKDN